MTTLDKAAKSISALFQKGMQGTASTEEQLIFVNKTLMPHLARPLLQQMGLLSSPSLPITLLDSACGTGVVTQEVQGLLGREALAGSRFVAADQSEMLVDIVRGRVEREGWVNMEVKVLDAMDTGLPSDTFSHVAIGLGLHLIPEPDKVIQDCIRILKPGGVLGFTTFQNDSPHEFWRSDMRSAFTSFPFEAPFPGSMPMQLHESGNWVDREWVETHLREVYQGRDTEQEGKKGLTDVVVKRVVGTHRFQEPEEWVLAFGSMLSWITGSWWSEETRRDHPMEEVKKLMADHLREKYNGEAWDVSWELLVATAKVS